MIANWLGAGPLIADHLTAQAWNDVNAILLDEDLAKVQEGNQAAPAFHVLYADFQITQDITEGVLVIAQFWDVIAVVYDAARNTRTLNAAGGELVIRALTALTGWRPSAEYQPLQPEPGAALAFSDDGAFGYYPMRYRTRFTIKTETGFLQTLYGI